MAQWHDAEVVERIEWNDHLFSIKFACPGFPKMKAGQFTKVGIEQSDGKILSRPYSLVNSPDSDTLEIIAVPVQEGSLSPKLHQSQVCDALKIMSPATGFLVLDEVPVSDTLFLIATGTGVGPFLSILETQQAWQSYKHIVLVYGARWSADLAYRQKINQWLTQYPNQFGFVPVVSREVAQGCLQGRIPQLIADGQIQEACGKAFEPGSCQVMLCGNPEMIQDALVVLEKHGLKKHLRRSPGQISLERYW
ncbi:ferredoxin--NADP reductase [Aliiglaciecola sp. M165]|uniref:ferredoxin--NADP reductase n=1 Tax=Aliiglaciecola sp. M165 TaxID=2593649 RepID=UPI00117F44D9|nr:ferredoxin--NADP reductase [Aliiglaciecola sp. M165]TRY33771.1 ferredoxin--NADP reductase [Aliiglaciecola sp. M165]